MSIPAPLIGESLTRAAIQGAPRWAKPKKCCAGALGCTRGIAVSKTVLTQNTRRAGLKPGIRGSYLRSASSRLSDLFPREIGGLISSRRYLLKEVHEPRFGRVPRPADRDGLQANAAASLERPPEDGAAVHAIRKQGRNSCQRYQVRSARDVRGLNLVHTLKNTNA